MIEITEKNYDYKKVLEFVRNNNNIKKISDNYYFLRFTDDATKKIYYDLVGKKYLLSCWVNDRGNTMLTKMYFQINKGEL